MLTVWLPHMRLPPVSLHGNQIGNACASELAKMNVHLVSISPDGKSLALNGTPGPTGEDILIASLEGAGAVRPFAQSKFNELAPAFSPDGYAVLRGFRPTDSIG